MSAKPPIDHYDYSRLVSEAFKQVVKNVLKQCAKDGLQGNHHFYISFDTNAENVTIPQKLKLAYPKEMTIVLQHEYYDFKVAEDYFSVTLLFNKQPSNLVVPYDAMRAFFDPAVDVKLFFQPDEHGMDLNAELGNQEIGGSDIKTRDELVEMEVLHDEPYQTDIIGLTTDFKKKKTETDSKDGKKKKPSKKASNEADAVAQVISLEQFRKDKDE